MERTIAILIIIIVALFAGATANAEELGKPTVRFISKGMMCNTQEEIETVITMTYLKQQGQEVGPLPDNCGSFVPEQPVLFIVTPSHWYTVPDARILVGTAYHQRSDWLQWIYLAVEPIEQGEPV